MSNIYINSPILSKLEVMRIRMARELDEAKRQHLNDLFNSDRLTEGQRYKFIMVFKSVERAFEVGFEKAITLLEDQIQKNDLDGTSTILIRDKRIDIVINEEK